MELPNHSWKILLHQRISLGTTVNSRATCPNTCQPGATIVCRAICIYIYISITTLVQYQHPLMCISQHTNVSSKLAALRLLFALTCKVRGYLHFHTSSSQKAELSLLNVRQNIAAVAEIVHFKLHR